MVQYVAFFRGINVGTANRVKMERLRKLFYSLGFTDVKSLLNSGNVVFHSSEKDTSTIIKSIEDAFVHEFGFGVQVFLREQQEIMSIVKKDIFGSIAMTPFVRLYATFLSDEAAKKSGSLRIPYESSDKSFRILKMYDRTLFSVLFLSEKSKTPEAMQIVEKSYGTSVTTRNWNTLIKIAAM